MKRREEKRKDPLRVERSPDVHWRREETIHPPLETAQRQAQLTNQLDIECLFFTTSRETSCKNWLGSTEQEAQYQSREVGSINETR